MSNDFDPARFANRWKIVAGDPPPPGEAEADFAVITMTKTDPPEFVLTYEGPNVIQGYRQTLHYTATTRTLDSRATDDLPLRSISFWEKFDRGGGETNYIFAIRRPNPSDRVHPPSELLPFENGRDNGTWGAEEG
ncbi:MAG: hypothetical protein AAGD38_20965 [Acidobacteriota bacterium]